MLLDVLWECIKDSPKQKVLQKKYLKNLSLAFSTYTLQKFNQIKLSALKHHFRVYETAVYASDVTVQFSLFSPVHLH